MRAHANRVENLPDFGAIVLTTVAAPAGAGRRWTSSPRL